MTATANQRSATVARIRELGIVPVVRASSAEQAVRVAEILVEAGLPVAEITMTVPDALDAIAAIQRALGEKILLGAGTVTDRETARAAIDAGAVFVVSPCLVPDVMDEGRKSDVVVMPGALTPTEIFTAIELGADLVKVFPAQSVGGADYLRALRGPFPNLPLVPTGGITLSNVGDFIRAGAVAVGIGSELVSRASLDRGDYAAVRVLATQFMRSVALARAAR